jgi:ATP-dependent exoDNAse (exonuclease V) beta subunit (contains helicase and exonuclease domains)
MNQITASAVTYEPGPEHEHGHSDVDTRNIPAAIYGHAVHRLCETRPPDERRRHVIEQAVQEQHDRTPGLTEATYPDSAYDAIETAADSAIRYLNTLHNTLDVQQIHDEYYIELSLDTGTVSGFIDHLIVTPDKYHVIDYKTDRKPTTKTTDEFLDDRAAHHQPQLQAYAAALSQQDPTRDVMATLYFTDIEDTYTWDSTEFTHALSDTVHQLKLPLDGTPVQLE